MWTDAGTAFVVLLLAEFGDKTQLTLVALTGRHGRLSLLAGAVAGFVLMTAVAVAVGAAGAELVSAQWIRWVSAAIFLLVGLWMLLQLAAKKDDEAPRVATVRKNGFWAAFGAVVILELGDKTQLATAALAARSQYPVAVFVGALAGLVVVSTVGIAAGSMLLVRLRRRTMEWIAALLFVGVGLWMLLW